MLSFHTGSTPASCSIVISIPSIMFLALPSLILSLPINLPVWASVTVTSILEFIPSWIGAKPKAFIKFWSPVNTSSLSVPSAAVCITNVPGTDSFVPAVAL